MGDRNVNHRRRTRRPVDYTRYVLNELRDNHRQREREMRLRQIQEEEELTRRFFEENGVDPGNWGDDDELDDLEFIPEGGVDDDDAGGVALDDDDDDANDDTLMGLWRFYRRRTSNLDLLIILLSLIVYITGQIYANRRGFGAAFFIFSVFVLILRNLGKRRPGEWSAYSVFNPNFQPIMGVRGREHPDQEIVPF